MIKIICIGKIKEKYIKEAIDDYKKRLNKYTKLEIIEINNIVHPNEKDIINKEGKLILNNIKPTDYVITLEILGHQLDSFEFCDKIESIFNFCSNIVFIIGGSYGLSKEVKERSDFSLSFSKMTFPHQLFRVFLLEQIYRAYKIMNNESYHK